MNCMRTGMKKNWWCNWKKNMKTCESLTRSKKLNRPIHLKMILRPYQVAGYQWLNYLRDIKWGGILADDMGLGKTVQALSFLEYYKNENGQSESIGGLSHHTDL